MDTIPDFINTLNHVKEHYSEYHFYCERDFVWTIQKLMREYFEKNNLPYRVYNDYPMEKGVHVDLAIVDYSIKDNKAIQNGLAQAKITIEFKFEPSKLRSDEICVHKLPVVFFSEVMKDVERVHKFVADKKTKRSIAILVDEYGRFKTPQHMDVSPQSKWIDWGSCGSDKLNISILFTEVNG